MYDMGGIRDGEQRVARAVETAAALRRAWLRLRASGLRLVVVSDKAAPSPQSTTVEQATCSDQQVVVTGQ